MKSVSISLLACIVALFVFSPSVAGADEDWFTDLETALAKAKETGNDVVLVFAADKNDPLAARLVHSSKYVKEASLRFHFVRVEKRGESYRDALEAVRTLRLDVNRLNAVYFLTPGGKPYSLALSPGRDDAALRAQFEAAAADRERLFSQIEKAEKLEGEERLAAYEVIRRACEIDGLGVTGEPYAEALYEADPDNVRGWRHDCGMHLVGLAYAGGEESRAVSLLEEIVKLDVAQSDSYGTLGLYYYRQWRWADASPLLEKGVTYDIANIELWLNLIYSYFNAELFSKGLDVIEHAFDVFRAYDQYLVLESIKRGFAKIVKGHAAESELRKSEESGDLPVARVVTSEGEFEIFLLEDDAPNTVANFIALSEAGFYNRMVFHYAEPGVEFRSGRVRTTSGAGYEEVNDAGYYIPFEKTSRPCYPGSFLLLHGEGQPDTGSSQFVAFVSYPPMKYHAIARDIGEYTAFARVKSGMDVLRKIRPDSWIKKVEIVRRRDHPYDVEKIEKDG